MGGNLAVEQYGMRYLIAFMLLTSMAWADETQLPCNDRDLIIARLASQFSEAPVALGLTSAGGLLEVTTTENGEEWTILITSPQGISCIVATGENWRSRKFQLPETES